MLRLLYPAAPAGARRIAAGILWAFGQGVTLSLKGVLAAWRLKSLRWNVFSHFLVDLLSLSVPVFLNLYALPGG